MKLFSVRLNTLGNVLYYDPGDVEVHKGDDIIVETPRGLEYVTAGCDPVEVSDPARYSPITGFKRLATDRDREQEENNHVREENARSVCADLIKQQGLDMRLIATLFLFDNTKLIFYFTADERVDFRELVRNLAGVFHTRIELRQIGSRDRAKIVGGIGICGRAFCCGGHIDGMTNASIRMAKEQDLSLNPGKLAGCCDRIMCCLAHEVDAYKELSKNVPGYGDIVSTPEGLIGTVQDVNILLQRVKVVVEVHDEREIRSYDASEVEVKHRKGRKESKEVTAAELQRLRELEEPGFLENRRSKESRETGRTSRDSLSKAAAKTSAESKSQAQSESKAETAAASRSERSYRDNRDRHGHRHQNRG